jgi:hypothetical protein
VEAEVTVRYALSLVTCVNVYNVVLRDLCKW